MDLNNRELAILVWIFLLLAIALTKPTLRAALSEFIKTMFSILTTRVMLKINTLLVLYVILTLYFLSTVDVFDWSQIKNVIIWFFSIALIPLFSLEEFSRNSKKYKEYCFSSLRILAIIQFVVGIYVFSFLLEMILVPLVSLFALLYAFMDSREEYENELMLKKVLINILTLYGFVLIVFTIYMAFIDYNQFASWHNLQDFLVPVLLTILYLPFVYFLVTYSCYERAFIRINFKFENHELRRFTKYYVLYKFNFSYGLLRKWLASLSLRTLQSKKDVKQSVLDVIALAGVERNPPSVSTNKGWSPYDAMKFLLKFGIEARNYHCLFDDEWFASSDFCGTSKEYKDRNKVIYYVTGNSKVAHSLKLNLTNNWIDTMGAGHHQLLSYASELFGN